MATVEPRRHRVGASIDDLCRACKATRVHTVMATDAVGRALRVMCDFCRSQHNYRGGGGDRPPATRPAHDAPRVAPRLASAPAAGGAAQAIARPASAVESRREPPQAAERLPERTGAAMTTHEGDGDLERLLRRVLREELGLTPGAPADKWRGGELVLRPGKPGVQEKSWPIDTFFHKVVMIRNRLRTLEQQVNAADLPEDLKLRLQSYVSGCYGSLTSFNVLFADDAERFKGSAGDD